MSEKGEVMTNNIEIGRIIRNFYQQIYAKKNKQSGRDGGLPGNLSTTKTETGRNRLLKQAK